MLRLLLALMIFTACSNRPSVGRAKESPAKEFVLYDVEIQDEVDGESQWVLRAKRATGDLAETALEDVTIDNGASIVMTAPTGTIDMNSSNADFETVTVTRGENTKLNASAATYQGKAGKILMHGPLDFQSGRLTAKAPSGEVDLAEDVIHVAGPIIGRYDPTAPQTR